MRIVRKVPNASTNTMMIIGILKYIQMYCSASFFGSVLIFSFSSYQLILLGFNVVAPHTV